MEHNFFTYNLFLRYGTVLYSTCSIPVMAMGITVLRIQIRMLAMDDALDDFKNSDPNNKKYESLT
jgi:hypothetical protein